MKGSVIKGKVEILTALQFASGSYVYKKNRWITMNKDFMYEVKYKKKMKKAIGSNCRYANVHVRVIDLLKNSTVHTSTYYTCFY